MTVREWLPRNGYGDVADLISEVVGEFDAAGSKERRNWADVLAGAKDGKPAVVAGREFPVLRSAQISLNKLFSANATSRAEEHEPFPSARQTGRWPKQLPVRATRLGKQSVPKTSARRAS